MNILNHYQFLIGVGKNTKLIGLMHSSCNINEKSLNLPESNGPGRVVVIVSF